MSTINVDDLRKGSGVHGSRNSNIARVLRENKYMRELGEGIRRIFNLLKDQELAPPNIDSCQGIFTISLEHKSIYSEREQLWLSLFNNYDLDQHQKKVVIAGIDGRKLSPAMIYAALGSNDRNLYDRTVTTLRIKGILREIHTSSHASKIARETKKVKQEIARFSVVEPAKISVPTNISNKIYIYNLATEIDEETLKTEMSIFGLVTGVKLPVDEKTGQIRGFAFIDFDNQESALKAVAIKNIKINECIASILPYKPYRRKIGRRNR